MFISSFTLCFGQQKMSMEATERIWSPYIYVYWGCMLWRDLLLFCHMEKVLVKVSPHDICTFPWTWWTRTYSSDHLHSYANNFALLVFGGKNLTFVFQGLKTGERWYIYICITDYRTWLNSSIIHKEHSLILMIYTVH